MEVLDPDHLAVERVEDALAERVPRLGVGRADAVLHERDRDGAAERAQAADGVDPEGRGLVGVVRVEADVDAGAVEPREVLQLAPEPVGVGAHGDEDAVCEREDGPLEGASAQAQNMVNEATQSAQQMMERAKNEAGSLVERASREASARMEAASAEAARMLEDAEKRARQLVEEESIVRRARVECDELRESARQEAAELHKNTLDYMDSLLAETDRKLSELINNIRLERNEIRNHR